MGDGRQETSAVKGKVRGERQKMGDGTRETRGWMV